MAWSLGQRLVFGGVFREQHRHLHRVRRRCWIPRTAGVCMYSTWVIIMGGKAFSLGKGRRTMGSRQASSLEFSDTITLIVMIAGEAFWRAEYHFGTWTNPKTLFPMHKFLSLSTGTCRTSDIKMQIHRSLLTHSLLLVQPIERATNTPALGYDAPGLQHPGPPAPCPPPPVCVCRCHNPWQCHACCMPPVVCILHCCSLGLEHAPRLPVGGRKRERWKRTPHPKRGTR